MYIHVSAHLSLPFMDFYQCNLVGATLVFAVHSRLLGNGAGGCVDSFCIFSFSQFTSAVVMSVHKMIGEDEEDVDLSSDDCVDASGHSSSVTKISFDNN
jgi:hypothetical protein